MGGGGCRNRHGGHRRVGENTLVRCGGLNGRVTPEDRLCPLLVEVAQPLQLERGSGYCCPDEVRPPVAGANHRKPDIRHDLASPSSTVQWSVNEAYPVLDPLQLMHDTSSRPAGHVSLSVTGCQPLSGVQIAAPERPLSRSATPGPLVRQASLGSVPRTPPVPGRCFAPLRAEVPSWVMRQEGTAG